MFLIIGYKKEVDEKFNSHKYPSYFSIYNGDEFGMQSGMYDALKFKSEKIANAFLNIANGKFGDRYVCYVVPCSELILGNYDYKYVIN